MRDLTIIGGGPVGLCAALVLQHPARRVSLIEAGELGGETGPGLGARSIALSYSSLQIFRAIGVWQQLQEQAAPIRHIHISARGRWGATRLAAADHGLDALGYVIEYRHLMACLHAAASAAKRIQLLDRADFRSIAQNDAVSVGYRRQKRSGKIESRLALIADGAQSRAREAIDIGHDSIDYGQTVLISNVEVSQPRADTAYERFTDQGPLAMLPLRGKNYACVWTLGTSRAEQVMQLDNAHFCTALQQEFGYRLGAIKHAGERFAMPLKRVRAEALQRGRCLVIGNAANALHPVAGQSFNLALRDIACIYELMIDQDLAQLDNESVGAMALDYERRRVVEQSRVVRYGDGLVSLFSNELPLLRQGRAVALGLLDLVPALKAQVTLSGMGMTFGGNRLLRGHL